MGKLLQPIINFIYSLDVRGKHFSAAKHWSAEIPFGKRGHFQTTSEPARLIVEPVKVEDQGIYRCRVDFRNSPSRETRLNLTIIGKSQTQNVVYFQQNYVTEHANFYIIYETTAIFFHLCKKILISNRYYIPSPFHSATPIKPIGFPLHNSESRKRRGGIKKRKQADLFSRFDPKCQSQADIWPRRRKVGESVTLRRGPNIQFVVNKIPSGCLSFTSILQSLIYCEPKGRQIEEHPKSSLTITPF